jgi:hypothetical protein
MRNNFEGEELLKNKRFVPSTTTAMHFILQNLLHRDRSDLTKALQDYCTLYRGHTLYPNLDPQPSKKVRRPSSKRKNKIVLHMCIP